MSDFVVDVKPWGKNEILANNVHLVSVPRIGEKIELIRAGVTNNYSIVEVIHSIEAIRAEQGFPQHRIILKVITYSEKTAKYIDSLRKMAEER